MKTKDRRQSKNVRIIEKDPVALKHAKEEKAFKVTEQAIKAMKSERLTKGKSLKDDNSMNIQDIISTPLPDEKRINPATLQEGKKPQEKLDTRYKPTKGKIEHLKVTDITPKK